MNVLSGTAAVSFSFCFFTDIIRPEFNGNNDPFIQQSAASQLESLPGSCVYRIKKQMKSKINYDLINIFDKM